MDSKVVRIERNIADAIEGLAEFFKISTTEASIILMVTDGISKKSIWEKTFAEGKITYARRRLLQKLKIS